MGKLGRGGVSGCFRARFEREGFLSGGAGFGTRGLGAVLNPNPRNTPGRSPSVPLMKCLSFSLFMAHVLLGNCLLCYMSLLLVFDIDIENESATAPMLKGSACVLFAANSRFDFVLFPDLTLSLSPTLILSLSPTLTLSLSPT
ncbi:unnamed protein product, partial [Discosporangium mesarthrocarpum]